MTNKVHVSGDRKQRCCKVVFFRRRIWCQLVSSFQKIQQQCFTREQHFSVFHSVEQTTSLNAFMAFTKSGALQPFSDVVGKMITTTKNLERLYDGTAKVGKHPSGRWRSWKCSSASTVSDTTRTISEVTCGAQGRQHLDQALVGTVAEELDTKSDEFETLGKSSPIHNLAVVE